MLYNALKAFAKGEEDFKGEVTIQWWEVALTLVLIGVLVYVYFIR